MSNAARVILGLQARRRWQRRSSISRLPNLCVLAGADLPPEKLVPLFRHCRIKRIDRVFELQLDPRQLKETLQRTSGEKLREILVKAGPLPATVDHLLRSKPLAGKVRIRGCSAIVQPENAEVLEAIRQHSRLKGYLEPGAPRGYLLIKPRSNPHNFVQRCEELGFKVTFLQG